MPSSEVLGEKLAGQSSLQRISSPTLSQRSGEQKRQQEVADVAKKLSKQRTAVVAKEQELSELRAQLIEQERSLKQLCVETGARKQRVNVNTLKGPPPVKQVGLEMAQAIRRRALRRKEILRDQVNKAQKLLGEKVAVNRELKVDIDHRRRARLYHLAAVEDGSHMVASSQQEISHLISVSQRMYAEKETIVLKLGELKRRALDEFNGLQMQMEQCDVSMEELDDECRLRDASV